MGGADALGTARAESSLGGGPCIIEIEPGAPAAASSAGDAASAAGAATSAAAASDSAAAAAGAPSIGGISSSPAISVAANPSMQFSSACWAYAGIGEVSIFALSLEPFIKSHANTSAALLESFACM